MIDLSVVIPAYNEADVLGTTIEEALAWLVGSGLRCEVIVVDDGSDDDTAVIVERDFPSVSLLRSTPNHGKGYAVRRGMMEGVGEYRVFFDADGSTPIGELEKLWPCFDDGADVGVDVK